MPPRSDLESLLSRFFDGLPKSKHGTALAAMATHCHKPNCTWLSLNNLTNLQSVPPLLPNPELSGIGVILGFSITAYLTLALLVLHYITVYDPRRKNQRGDVYVNDVDRGLLTFVRERIIAWTPGRRFEYAMEKSVLILSDIQVVTGLAILIAGYSQLDCGISAYHWQIMVFVAWFSSFTFLSAMTFLEDYFQTNHSLRSIRVFFMFVLSSLLIAALLPTGSQNWLDLLNAGGGFYPSLSAACYFKQVAMDSFTDGGPRLWSMIFSVLVVAFSYIHSGIRLFDPTAELTRKYFRTLPGNYVKRFLYSLEKKLRPGSRWAALWVPLYLFAYAAFTITRAFYDIAESMLLEILWLSFAIAWGTIKIWDTRNSARYNSDGDYVSANEDVLDEDAWSFGQTLPLVLILLPLLSMAQAYLDNDAKAQEAVHGVTMAEKGRKGGSMSTSATANLSTIRTGQAGPNKLSDFSSGSTPLCTQNASLRTTNAPSTNGTCIPDDIGEPSSEMAPPVPGLPRHLFSPPTLESRGSLLPHPDQPFSRYPWYRDQILLLLLQLLVVTAFVLYLLIELANILGISTIVQNRLFLIWALGLIPAASFIHLSAWLVAALVVQSLGCQAWLKGKGQSRPTEITKKSWWKRITLGQLTFWFLRMFLVCGCVSFTVLLSLEIVVYGSLFEL